MFSRLFRQLIVGGLCLILSSGPALAQNGNGPANNNGNGNPNPGSGNDNGNPNGNSSDNNTPPSLALPTPSVSVPAATRPPPSSSTASDQDVALKAVEDARALPFETISNVVHETNAGEIIDARLLTVEGFLLYEVKVLNGGELDVLYYYARSGKRVGG
jgi:hypothetical protein